MSSTVKIVIGIVLSFMLLIGGTAGYVVSAKFAGETFEVGILAQDESMQNTWAAVGKELKMAGFTVKSGDKFSIDKIKAQAERYKNDSGTMMKWIQEAQPGATEQTRVKFMNIITKGYAREEAKQLSKISYVQEYRTWRKASMKGSIAVAIFSFPSPEVKKIEDRIITTKEVKKTWISGEHTAVDP